MRILIMILNIFMILKTIPYGLFEIKNNKNKFGGIVVIIFAILSAIFCNVMVYLR